MAEEFQESQVIFQENAGDEDVNRFHFTLQSDSRELRNNNNIKRQKKKKKKKKKRNSVPINVPENLSRNCWLQYVDSDLFDDEYDNDDGGITPPHVILERRIAGKMAFSVCTGNGRTLKGRDLSQVRNSILRMTGFLET